MKVACVLTVSLNVILFGSPTQAQVSLKVPWRSGESWVMTCGYGCGFHTDAFNSYYALDFDKPGLAENGEPQAVLAPVSGNVIFAGLNGGFGYSVKIEDGSGFVVMVSHLRFQSTVSGFVVQGQPVGIMGGTSSGGVKVYDDHIHLQLYFNGKSKSFIPQSKPEPMSGYTDFQAGRSYISDNVPIESSLKISTGSCPAGISCTGPQGTTFNFSANGLTPGSAIQRFIEDLGGARSQLMPVLTDDSSGRLNWSFTSSCATAVGTFTIFTIDVATSKESNRVTETMTPGNCVPPPTEGTLDPTFGFGGKVTTDIGGVSDRINAIAAQPDGKLIVAGVVYRILQPPPCCPNFVVRVPQFAVVRYHPIGTVDTSFGTGGKLIVPAFQQAEAIAIQPDGKILVGGTGFCCSPGATSGAVLIRLNPDGSFDSSFGNGGVVETTFLVAGLETFPGFVSLAIQPDGKILAAGEVFGGFEAQFDFVLARFNSNGSLDPTFGIGGKVTTDIAGGIDQVKALVLQLDGRIVLGGISRSPISPDKFTLVRYTTTGMLDSMFGTGGKVTTDFGGSFAHLFSLDLHTDGRIVAAGRTRSLNTGNDLALARYNANGTLDPTFGNAGKVITDFFGLDDSALAVAIQQDGRVVAVGHAVRFPTSAAGDFAVVRYNIDGSPDSTFGTNGNTFTDFFGFTDGAMAIVIDSRGDIVAAGFARRANQDDAEDFALVRYLGAP